MRIRWTRRYLNELSAIATYIAERNPQAAARVVAEIHGKTRRLLSANPFIGRRGEINGTRELVIPGTPYIVAYSVQDSEIDVLFVQHGARQWPDEL